MEPLDYVAVQIKNLRMTCNGGEGISQEALAREVKVATNTISRWETGVYRPSLDDLERLSRFFEVSITSFFPPETQGNEDDNWLSLLRTAKQLHPDDLMELTKYAEFRKARRIYEGKNKIGPRRKTTTHK
jgi:transcriptional regulator with XRE-family HTH domain